MTATTTIPRPLANVALKLTRCRYRIVRAPRAHYGNALQFSVGISQLHRLRDNTRLGYVIIAAVVLASACRDRARHSGGTRPSRETRAVARVDSTGAVALAREEVRRVVGPSVRDFRVARTAPDSGGFLVVLVPPCDTSSGVDSAGRQFHRGCGGGDYTVWVGSTGVVWMMRGGQ